MAPPLLFTAIKVGFLVLLYLFLLAVVRTVMADVSGRAWLRSRPRAPRKVAVVVGGKVVARVRLDDPLVVGRAAACQLVLDDEYVSQLHARFFKKDGVWWVEDLGSTNGTFLNRSRVIAPTPVAAGDEVRVGKTTLLLKR